MAARRHCACESERWCCVIDMDMFYAAVEIRDDPSLHDVPLAVGGDSMISTANYVARKYGVRAAMPGFIARELCRRQGVELRFKPVDMPRYQAASKIFKDTVSLYGPMKMLSLDEAYIDITAKVAEAAMVDESISEVEAASLLVSRMREEVCENSSGLTCSAGIARGCFRLAKMASDVNKPNGQFMVPTTTQGMLEWLHSMPIRKLHGVGRVSERELSAGLGIHKVGDIIIKAAELLHAMSSSGGHWLIDAAMGVADMEDVTAAAESGPKSISQERSLSTAKSGSAAYLHEVLEELCSQVMELCAEKEQYGRCVTVKLKTFEWDVKQKSNTLKREVRSGRLLYSAASELMSTALATLKKPIRLLGVRVSSFQTAVPQGQSTLGDFLAAHKASSSRVAVDECITIESHEHGGIVEAWNCTVCTFLNKATDRRCEMCHENRVGPVAELGSSRGSKRPMLDGGGSRARKVHKKGAIERYMTRRAPSTSEGSGMVIDLTQD
ncbi:DNA polymerase IV, putative [Perkinsus marinus ATCC 50983]|uniref:DNA polymerase kappa n=1 Tax=Perkinsus marinus (strain ATCC 50983 / TXsc) TaxID=423536 RepID=C5L1X5_PERM5|nr:DNA polymerase IV, putative [Perkinsus marinus ATCC 50983]EER09244.1 DNA polymerase IV, putative [Perkinsus marinus ATCC 50983]|eukprot:XP_002777428.1 DNA polymerase IV, putative [Perkinsus marinus ATCC 50983]